MNHQTHFWVKGEVITFDGWFSAHSAPAEMLGFFCVDTSQSEDDMRYGKYLKKGWKAFELWEFPPKFRTHLLLLGVS